ncbi:MAG: anti-sigma factor antagonist [Acidimicrobiaceae bacterium]|jgi:anti-sigma B factor antagonist
MTVNDPGETSAVGLDVVSLEIGEHEVRLLLSGEVDLATAGLVVQAVEAAAANGATSVELDLSEVPFIDSSGIAAIVRSHRALQAVDGRLTIGSKSPPVARVIELSGVEIALSDHV